MRDILSRPSSKPGLDRTVDQTGLDGGLDRTGPDKYTGEHKLLSAREVTIATCVQAIQIQQAATSMEQAVEIQQSATVTSMEQVIEIASDDSDFESDTSTEGGFVSDSEGEEELQEAIRRSLVAEESDSGQLTRATTLHAQQRVTRQTSDRRVQQGVRQ